MGWVPRSVRAATNEWGKAWRSQTFEYGREPSDQEMACLLYTSDAADDSLRVDLGGRRIIKKRAQ